MRIAVLADTHDRLPARLAARLVGAEELWHLGDVCDPSILVELQMGMPGVPLRVVRGNNDDWSGWPLFEDVEAHGVRCHLVHIPPRRAPAGTHLLLHGHTHVPRDETDPLGVRWLNPGCVSLAYRGAPASFAWLTLGPGGSVAWDLVML